MTEDNNKNDNNSNNNNDNKTNNNADNVNDNMKKGAILVDEMGLGKTLMTISIIFALHRKHRHHVRNITHAF